MLAFYGYQFVKHEYEKKTRKSGYATTLPKLTSTSKNEW